jgi:hypothetical protein
MEFHGRRGAGAPQSPCRSALARHKSNFLFTLTQLSSTSAISSVKSINHRTSPCNAPCDHIHHQGKKARAQSNISMIHWCNKHKEIIVAYQAEFFEWLDIVFPSLHLEKAASQQELYNWREKHHSCLKKGSVIPKGKIQKGGNWASLLIAAVIIQITGLKPPTLLVWRRWAFSLGLKTLYGFVSFTGGGGCKTTVN